MAALAESRTPDRGIPEHPARAEDAGFQRFPGDAMARVKVWLQRLNWIEVACLVIVLGITGYASLDSI